ncbi:hypothetical protein UG55_11051, partial [Frankia sp. EI5c]
TQRPIQDPSKRAGTVANQSPASGNVSRGATVTLFVVQEGQQTPTAPATTRGTGEPEVTPTPETTTPPPNTTPPATTPPATTTAPTQGSQTPLSLGRFRNSG